MRPTPDAAQVQASLARAVRPLQAEGSSADALTRELKDVMWNGCGLVRSRAGLTRAAEALDALAERAADAGAAGTPEWNIGWQQALDVVNQLEVARTMVASALVREESRGAHFREDFPAACDERWLRYVVSRRTPDGAVETETRPVLFTHRQPLEESAA